MDEGINNLRKKIETIKNKLVMLSLLVAGTTSMSAAKSAPNPGETKNGGDNYNIPTFAQLQEVDGVGYYLNGKEVDVENLGEKMLDRYVEEIVQKCVIPDMIELNNSVPATRGDRLPQNSVNILEGTKLEGKKGRKLGAALEEMTEENGIMGVADFIMDSYIEGDLSSKYGVRTRKSLGSYQSIESLREIDMLEQMRPGFFFMTDASDADKHRGEYIAHIVTEVPKNNIEILAKIRSMEEGNAKIFAINEYLNTIKCQRVLYSKDRENYNFIIGGSVGTAVDNLVYLNYQEGANLRVYCGSLQEMAKERIIANGVNDVEKLMDFANNNTLAKKHGVGINLEVKNGCGQTYTEFAKEVYLTQPLKNNTKAGKLSMNFVARQGYMDK